MTPAGADVRARLRALPAVDRLAAAVVEGGVMGGDRSPATLAEAAGAARVVLARRREEIVAGARDAPDLAARGRALLRPSLRRVLNGTGVVIHTNLGRAPLSEAAAAAVAGAAGGYANVELDLASGRRGSRHDHVRDLLTAVTGAQDGFAVNNAAGAVLLAAAALAGPSSVIVVSRGQLVEIGGSFRVPDVVAQSGARLVEVGTTNRTRLSDYEHALADHGSDAVIMRAHQSNFRTVGFVEDVEIEPLCALGVPVIDDVGSGALAADLPALSGEPPVRRSVDAGAALVCFSADKLLGGPQAGILVGAADAIDACRRHPLARALRIGRLPLAALCATLALYRDPARAVREVPVLAMLMLSDDELRARADQLAAAGGGELIESVARVGGGALPLLELNGPVAALGGPGADPGPLAAALRNGDPPLMTRIAGGRVLVDPRTLAPGELDAAAAAIAAATG